MQTNKQLTFNFIESLFWYDFSMISIGVTTNNEYVLLIYCDSDVENDITTDLWAYCFFEEYLFHKFLNNEISYYNLILQSDEIITFNENKLGSFNFTLINHFEFISLYGPQPDCDFGELDKIKLNYNSFLNNLINN